MAINPSGGDGFRAELDGLTAASQALAGQRAAPTGLARGLDAVATVQTGDPSLDARIRALAERLSAGLTRLSEAIGQDADGLAQVADTYRSADADVAAGAGMPRAGAQPALTS